MGYEKKTIRKMMEDIESSKVYLPALQRKFVWGKHQIQMLFDSLMRNYPIGTFLFWKLPSQKANSYVFYEFLREYDSRSPYNQRFPGNFLQQEITGVLDGQQRLSSMYIGLQGTHTEKAPYKKSFNDKAYQKTRLYLNLLSLPYKLDGNSILINEEKDYEFRFLTDAESINYNSRKVRFTNEEDQEVEAEEKMFWFKVGDILKWGEDPEIDIVIDELIEKCFKDDITLQIKTQRRFIRKGLEILYNRIAKDDLINYFEVSKDDLEDILKIFIRVNSGGTQLSKTDLLFSTIVATWDDGREEIEALLKRINAKGEGFNFSNEYLMRCCLVLTDSSVLFKVNSFKSENVQKIKDEWVRISVAIAKTVDLLVEFGFNGSLLASQNATIMIAYYIMKGGAINSDTKKEIRKYLIHALLNGIYGNSQDQLIIVLRNALRLEQRPENGKPFYELKMKVFSFEELLKVSLPSRKSLYVTEIEIDKFLTYKKSASSFFVLSLLYPNLRYKEVQFHQDHIHPASHFSSSIFDQLALSKEEREEWLILRDTIPNLQLMEGRQNESKNASTFKDWMNQKEESERGIFCVSNYISKDVAFEFAAFKSFYEMRKEKLKNELKRVLAVTSVAVPPIAGEEIIEDLDDDQNSSFEEEEQITEETVIIIEEMPLVDNQLN